MASALKMYVAIRNYSITSLIRSSLSQTWAGIPRGKSVVY